MPREVKTLGRNDTLDIARDVMALGCVCLIPTLKNDAERKTQ